MASITQIEQQVTALAVRMADEIDAVRAEMAAAGLGGTIAWADISGIPLTFTPAAHTHVAADVTDFSAAVDARIALTPPGSPTWASITGKPTTFPPDAHAHVTSDVTGLQGYVDGRIALAGAGTGNVFGPAVSVVGHLALFNDTGGTLLSDAGAGVSANGLSLISAANYAAMRTALGLVIGTDVQAQNAKLAAIAGMTWAADKGLYTTGAGAITTFDLSAFARTLLDDADAAAVRSTLGVIEPFPVALSDENTVITAGVAKVTFRAPYACLHVQIPRLSLKTASSSGLFTVDANINGVSMLSTKLSCDATERSSKDAATAAVMSTSTWDDDDEITVDVDAAGANATGAKIIFYLRRL